MWSKDQVLQAIASNPNGEEKLHNSVVHLAAISQAVDTLKITPKTVWFQQGFTPEQQVQRAAIIKIAASILEAHRAEQLAHILNTLQIPEPNEPTA